MTNPPPKVILPSEAEYLQYYCRAYCMSQIIMPDGIRVFFKKDKFYHAFYKPSLHKGPKDTFDPIRAERIDWIKATLENPLTTSYQGWNSTTRLVEPHRRVCIVYYDFVVIVEMYINRNNELSGNFITCFVADNSINKIESSPLWDRSLCINELKEIYGR